MKNKSVILFMSFLYFVPGAHATVIDICDLAATPIDQKITSQVSNEQKKSYQNLLAKECDLSKTYVKLNEKLRQKNNISLTDIAEYQAIRFVQRSWLQRAEYEKKPVEIIYQVLKTQYQLPYSSQSAAIWDDWAVGMKQLEPMVEAFKKGESFDLKALKKIHRGLFPFFPMIDEHGDFAHDPKPGVLKPTLNSDASSTYWWLFKTAQEAADAKKVVDNENAKYRTLGLVTPAPNGLPDYVSHILDVRETISRKDGEKAVGLFSGSMVVNRQNIELILNMVDTLLKQARAGQHMIWKNNLITPAQLAYFVQQAYVRVHAFYEGNGRTSRFLQELILMSFNLPHGASGDLMDFDALTESGEYYDKAMGASSDLLNRMKKCYDDYNNLANNADARSLDPSQLSYGCRILENRSATWQQMKYENEVTNQTNFVKKTSELAELDSQNEINHQRDLAKRLKP